MIDNGAWQYTFSYAHEGLTKSKLLPIPEGTRFPRVHSQHQTLMSFSRFKPVFYRHTTFVGVVCLALLGVALWMILYSHDHLERISESQAESKSELIARQFAQAMAPVETDSLDVDRFIKAARAIDHVAYLVVTDSSGVEVAFLNAALARRAGYRIPINSPEGGTASNLYRFGHPIDAPGFRGHMFLGFEREPIASGLQGDKRLLQFSGWVLLVVAFLLMASIGRFHVLEVSMSRLRKARRDLALQKGSLESEVFEQKEKEVQLKQSEERYRSLLESTMQSAFKDLERQKKDLEKEVEEKTATQKVLRRTTRRLRMLNGIERKIVNEETLDSIVGHAVDELHDLLAADRISVLQIDTVSGMVSVRAESGKNLNAANEEGQVPLDWYRPFKKGLFVARNLQRMDERFPIENMAIEHGIMSYCRVTLTAGEQVAGALHVAHAEAGQFDEEYLKVVRDVADLLSIALRQHVHGIERKKYNEELIAERDRAEEMARLKTAFLTNMTHEIRTPLSGIIGFAQVLHEELDDERKEFASHIQTAGKRLMDTINSVLDLSRLQADKASLQMKTLDASAIVKESLKVLLPLAQSRSLDYRIDVPDGVEATLDEKALETVVNNLVGNAIKFTEKGFVSISMVDRGPDLQLEVSDSGIGISEEFMPLLFDEFRQEYMGADRPAEGSGLGLAITSRIVEKMNGRLEVESRQGEGSTFRVVFVDALTSPVSRGSSAAPSIDRKHGGSHDRVANSPVFPTSGRTDAIA